MKKFMLLVVAIMGIMTVGFGQVKKGQQMATIKTPSVQCEMCKKKIEEAVKREEGVIKVNVDYKKKQTKVTFWTDRTNIENVKTIIANTGYDADDVTAEPEAYNRLPKCCKKPAGGGAKKE